MNLIKRIKERILIYRQQFHLEQEATWYWGEIYEAMPHLHIVSITVSPRQFTYHIAEAITDDELARLTDICKRYVTRSFDPHWIFLHRTQFEFDLMERAWRNL
jgi:hypothetical protein